MTKSEASRETTRKQVLLPSRIVLVGALQNVVRPFLFKKKKLQCSSFSDILRIRSNVRTSELSSQLLGTVSKWKNENVLKVLSKKCPRVLSGQLAYLVFDFGSEWFD